MRQLLCLTNIPTPYRVHFYNALAEELRNRAISMQVEFMAASEPGRHWTFDPRSWEFEHNLSPGLHPVVAGRIFHLNPTVAVTVARQRPDWLLLSGSWFLPTVHLAAVTAKITGTKRIFWSESNLAYVEHNSPAANWWRSRIMATFDGFVVPGQWARDYVLHFAPSAAAKSILTLPNVVNERLFRDEVALRRRKATKLRQEWNIASEQVVLVTFARLEPIKGVMELVEALLASPAKNRITLLVAGEGSLRSKLELMTGEMDHKRSIRLLGHLSENELMDLLAMADAFILPSLGDPYPLSVIEAAFAGLPLLLSDRIGCHPEALIQDHNGLLFDPHNSSSIQSCIEEFMQLGAEEWKAMGARSLELAEQRFRTDLVVSRFVDQLTEL